MLPGAYVVLDSLPLNDNKKIDRKSLPPPDKLGLKSVESHVLPRTPTEEVLAEIMAKVLGVERVGASDNFFDLGGHSLIAAKVMSRVREAFSIEMPVRSLFEAPKVAELAKRVEAEMMRGQELSLTPIVPVPRGGQLPVSLAQHRLWFLHQLDIDSSAYNVSAGVRIEGPLNVAILGQSLDEIIRRHESLRTRFESVDGNPVQVIVASHSITMRVIDLRDVPDGERDDYARRLANREARHPFRLSESPPLRLMLIRVGDQDYVMLFTMHHIISDGWSADLMTQEIAALYKAFEQGEPSPLAEMAIQYADYAMWQREWLQGEVLQKQLSYWKQQLADLRPLELRTDLPRPAAQTFRGHMQTTVLPEALNGALKDLSRREGATLFMTLLAAFKILLHHHSEQYDIAVGTDVAGRNPLELERLVGFFVNQLVLRTRFDSDTMFLEVLREVRKVVLEAFIHQDIPFNKLVEELRPERDPSRNPLFQVLFVLQHESADGLMVPSLKLSPYALEDDTAKFDITLFMTDTGGGLAAIWKYSTDLFKASTVAQMMSSFSLLLTLIADRPDATVGELTQAIAEAERTEQVAAQIERKAINSERLGIIKRKVVNTPDQSHEVKL